MKKLHHLILKTFLWLCPVGILLSILSYFDLMADIQPGILDLLIVMTYTTWLMAGGYTFVIVIFNRSLRDNILTKLAGIKERDERESFIVASAMKRSFLATFAVLLVLSASSLFRFEKDVTESTDTTVKGSLTFGHVEFTPQKIDRKEVVEEGAPHIYVTYGLPLSQTGLLAMILAIQILSFRFSLYRFSRVT